MKRSTHMHRFGARIASLVLLAGIGLAADSLAENITGTNTGTSCTIRECDILVASCFGNVCRCVIEPDWVACCAASCDDCQPCTPNDLEPCI